MIRTARAIVVALLATATLAVAHIAPAQAKPATADQPVVEFVVASAPRTSKVPASTILAPGDDVWVGIIVNDIWRGEVGLVSHTGGYWDLYVCDDRADGVQVAARIDPGDGRVLPYYDSDTNGLTCYERDIWYDIRKFRTAWGSAATPWFAPPPL